MRPSTARGQHRIINYVILYEASVSHGLGEKNAFICLCACFIYGLYVYKNVY